MYRILLLAPFYFLFSCNNNVRDLSTNPFHSKGSYNSEGNEQGKWQYFTSSNEMVEEGLFENGIKVGKWRYYFPYYDSIIWYPYNNDYFAIKTNLPDFLVVQEVSYNFLTFRNRDSSKLFKLVVGKNYSNNFYNYNEMLFEDLKRRNVVIEDTVVSQITTESGKQYLYNYIKAFNSENGSFCLFNIVGFNEANELIEVSLRCEINFEIIGRRVFFSVIPSLFIDSAKFLRQREEILYLTTDDDKS